MEEGGREREEAGRVGGMREQGLELRVETYAVSYVEYLCASL